MVIFINQIRMKIGVMFGNPETTSGGNALKFYSSVRMDIRRIGAIKDKDQIIGNSTRVKVIKNKVAPPFRTAHFQIHFGKGIVEHEELFDLLRKHGGTTISNRHIEVSGSGQWKKLEVTNTETGEVIVEKKFRKKEF